jgi:hypothetical protein
VMLRVDLAGHSSAVLAMDVTGAPRTRGTWVGSHREVETPLPSNHPRTGDQVVP